MNEWKGVYVLFNVSLYQERNLKVDDKNPH